MAPEIACDGFGSGEGSIGIEVLKPRKRRIMTFQPVPGPVVFPAATEKGV